MARYLRNPPPRRLVVIRPRKKQKFRWGIVLVPCVILVALWFASGIIPGASWNDVMDAIGTKDRERASELMILGLLAVAVVSVSKILRKEPKEGR